MIGIKTMEKAINYILNEKSGYRKDLIEYLNNDVEFVDELALLGYIAQGVMAEDKNKYRRTWRKTKKAEDYCRLYIN